MKSLIAALQFLTICPGVARVACSEKEIGRSTAWFPVVGLLIGAAVAGLDRGTSALFPSLLSSVIAVVALAAAAGGLHADGLADTADGFLSSRPRERVLEIMRDSRTGAMGVLAIGCMLLLKTAALDAVPGEWRWPTLVLMPLTGRCSMVLQLHGLGYARSGGLCSVFITHGRRLDGVLALAVPALVAWFMSGPQGLCAVTVSFLAVGGLALWSRSKIGGFTGDTLGAGSEVAELAVALAVAAWH